MKARFIRGIAAVSLLATSLAVAAVGVPGVMNSHDGTSSMAMASATTPDTTAQVAGLTALPQPQVAPPVGNRQPTTVQVSLETKEIKGLMADGVGYDYWTFNGTVPGPMIRAEVGDTVEVTIKNSPDSSSPHSIDLHAVTGPGGGATVTQVKPGSTATFTFQALHPGTYVYHCATPMPAMHIANGMYGMIVVEPQGGLPPVDHEYYVMQGDFYTSGNTGAQGMQNFDMTKMQDEQPTYVVFNGSTTALTGDNALQAKVGDTVRIFFGDGGPNLTSSFHIIGESFDTVAVEGGTLLNHDVQTTSVAPGSATYVELKLEYPGNYTLVDHAIERVMKGAAGTLHVSGEADPSIFNVVTPGDAGTGGH